MFVDEFINEWFVEKQYLECAQSIR
jgi:hypothetical protein